MGIISTGKIPMIIFIVLYPKRLLSIFNIPWSNTTRSQVSTLSSALKAITPKISNRMQNITSLNVSTSAAPTAVAAIYSPPSLLVDRKFCLFLLIHIPWGCTCDTQCSLMCMVFFIFKYTA